MKEIEKKVCDLIAAVWLSGLDFSKKGELQVSVFEMLGAAKDKDEKLFVRKYREALDLADVDTGLVTKLAVTAAEFAVLLD